MELFFTFRIFVKKLVCSIIVSVVLVGVLILSTPIFLYRKVLNKFVNYNNPNVLTMMDSRSAALAVDDMQGNPVVSEVFSMVLEGENQLNIEDIRKTFREKALEHRSAETGKLQYPELRQCVTVFKSYPFWRNIKNFKLEDYVYVHPEYKGEPYNYQQLMKLSCKLKSKPFPGDKAIWELIFIPKFIPHWDPKPNWWYSALLYRQHHCLADGFSKIKFLQQLSFHPPPSFMKVKAPKRDWITTALIYSALVLKLPFEIADLILTRQPKEIWKFSKNSEGVSINPTMKYMGAISKKIPLKTIKDLKNKYEVSFSAVAITAATAAMSSLMLELDTNSGDIIMPMPFPMGNHPDQLRNHFSFAFLKVPMNEPNIAKRLKLIDKRLEKLKRSAVSILLGGVLGQLLTSFPIEFVRKMMETCSAGHGMMLTNFPGPTREMDLFGHSLKEIYTCGPAGSGTLGVIATFITYGDYGIYGIGGDLAIIPNEKCAEEVINKFHAALDSLRSSFYEKDKKR